jgi:hypothetical protein
MWFRKSPEERKGIPPLIVATYHGLREVGAVQEESHRETESIKLPGGPSYSRIPAKWNSPGYGVSLLHLGRLGIGIELADQAVEVFFR